MMKLKSVKSIMNLSKRAIVMGINDQFRRMSKKQVAMIYYGLLKSKLPRLKVRKSLAYNGRIDKRRKKKRKFSRKQLAAQRLFAKRARAGTLRKRRRR
jgi:hypothetical protein